MSKKLIVITGCTRGCGRALTEFFAAQGCVVAGCGRAEEQIHALSEQLPAPHLFSALDVTDDQAVRRWAQDVIASHGAPDFLINNAAVINANAPLWEVPAEDFSRVVDVNIKGVANTIRHFAPAMNARGSGVIVNFSSGWGRSTSPDVAPYCATKYAVEGMTEALSQELPRGLAAIALNPGTIDTEMLRSCFGASAAQHPNPQQWAQRAGPYILSFGPKQNGRSLSV
jgi:NAD(P)-dependent dehydrogenase (short-subunit alcohol dehydrogenase family)